MGLKDFYYSLEDKWYAFWEKIDKKIPVYKVIDRIDKIIPSFALFLIIIIFLILFFLITLFSVETQQATFTIKDFENKIVEDSIVNVKILSGENIILGEDFRTNSLGEIFLENLFVGQEIILDINLNRGHFKGSFMVVEGGLEEEIILLQRIVLRPIQRNIYLEHNNASVQKPIRMDFSCENSSIIPEPKTIYSQQGMISVTEPINCIRLYGKIVSDEYENTLTHISSTTQRITLLKPEPPRARLTINIRSNGLPINNTSFNIRLEGENNYSRFTNSSSETMEVVQGTYFLSVSDPDNDYGTVTKTIIVNNDTQENIELSKTIKSNISVSVVDQITGQQISGAIVTIKNNGKRVIDQKNTGEDGRVLFAVTDKGNFFISAKKVGGINEGYFAKEIELVEPELEASAEIRLEKITINNAGKTVVRVIDQDNEIVHNARVTLRFEKDDTLVELNENQNFVLTDINGYATFLAGKVVERVYAHANKYPFLGTSAPKIVNLEGENNFEVIMQIGSTPIEILVKNEKGEEVEGEARLYTIENKEATGLIAIEKGRAITTTKAGKTVFLEVKSENETYYSEPRFLWPNKKEVFDIIVYSEINEPKIIADGKLEIFNEQGQIVRTMKAGNKYYTLIRIDSDRTYNNALLHFRAGKENLLENDYIEIDNIQTIGEYYEVRGKSFDPERGYEYDSQNLTIGLAKWVTINWTVLPRGTIITKINFRIKEDTPKNKELQFFWRANFDGEKKPESNEPQELYDNTYASNIFFEGEEAVCIEDYCIMGEYLFDKEEELYVDKPFELQPVHQYHYQYQIINNSRTDYGVDKKRMGLNLELLGEDGVGAKIIDYKIIDSKNNVSGGEIKSIKDLEIGSFEKNTTINIILTLEGNKTGNSAIRTELKTDGRIIFTNEENFIVPNQKQLNITLDKSFVPSLVNEKIIVDVRDNQDPVNEASIKVFAKEPGFEQYIIEETITNRLGKAEINTGAHFPRTKILIEIAKKGFARRIIELTVREDVVEYNPPRLDFRLNTITQREERKEFQIGNATGKNLEIFGINVNANFRNAINEDALKSYLSTLKGKTIKVNDIEDLDLIMRIHNSLTPEMMIEPINIEGEIVITLRALETNILFDTILPININIGSGAQTEATCIILSDAVQKKVTEKGRVIFYFELLNACEANGVPVKITNLTASSNDEIEGMADIQLQSYTTPKSGRTGLDSMNREILSEINPGERLVGTVTYIPNERAAGKTINLPITLQAKFQGRTITTSPSQLRFSVDVINLKECLKIESTNNAVAFREPATVTIDSTRCLGQQIDIWLCRNNPGCGGGTPEGRVTLGRNNFTTQNSKESVSVTVNDLPGSYGVTVWARISGGTTWSFIGEAPVAFKEPEGKFFELNKYEINIIGEGMQDTILLTNRMLDQEVKVRATNEVWGKQAPRMNWLQVIGGAAIGASLGNMIGGAFESRSQRSPSRAEGGRAELTARTSESIDYSDEISRLKARVNDSTFSLADQQRLNTLEANQTFFTDLPQGTHHLYADKQGTITTIPQSGTYIGTATHENGAWGWKGIGTNVTGDRSLVFSTGLGNPVQTQYDNSNIFTRNIRNTLWRPRTTTQNQKSILPENNKNMLNQFNDSQKISFSKIIFPTTEWKTETKEDLPKISFGKVKGWSTAIGAILGGIAAWYMQEQARKDFLKQYSIASYRDFVIFLQGDTIGVSGPGGAVEKTIPGDAGPLYFSLSNIGVEWDFTNADYSSIENVGLKFTNEGINETLPSYGVLTINANVNKHGSAIVAPGLRSTTEYDVTCNNPSFGNYWIGSESDAGACTGISKSNYSQKYHVRVISGEPTEEEPRITSATTCNNGVITGITGPDAVPRIKLDWSWQNIDYDMCDYGNPNYVYCDGVQFTVSLVKKLAVLQEFFKLNNYSGCPEDPIRETYMQEFDEINSLVELVAEGVVGVKDIEVSVINDRATARVTVENRTGEAIETYVSALWKGEGEPNNDLIQQTFPVGTTIIEFSAGVSKWDDTYFFTAVANGPRGNRRVVTRAFFNLPPNIDCWAQPTTRSVGGIPSIMYFLAEKDNIQWTNNIPDASTLYSYINFGSYLMRENYSKELFKDVGDYYLNQIFEIIDDTEKDILRKIRDGKLNVVKRFSNQASFEAGLYDIWLDIDFEQDFDLLLENTDLGASLLLVRVPNDINPLYKMPFNGRIGENGRANYGVTYNTQGNSEIKITNDITTNYNTKGNGVVEITTNIESDFSRINASIGTRGQIASISHRGTIGEILFTPQYATPVIAKYTLEGTSGKLTYDVERNFSPITTGGNINFWTGAARSRSFFGGGAIDHYNNTPDSRIEEKYGFSWRDATHPGTIYLKTIFYTPTNNTYYLKTDNSSFWTPNTDFGQTVELRGIEGMRKNQLGDYFETLQELLEMVEDQTVCISNDGSTMSFWWNPRALATTPGSNNSLSQKELALAGN